MTVSRVARLRLTLAFALVTLAVVAVPSQALAAEELPDDGGAAWRLEQPAPPEPPAGVQGSSTPIGLGHVGDIEFFKPNRGLLITSGNGSTIAAGLWTYDGTQWTELADVCGATEGRIALAAPDEFWTISDGRPGQAANPNTGAPAPLADLTLCHFAHGEVVGSYASLAFQASSYQPLDAGACAEPADCWFAGEPSPEPQVGAFHLHWNGVSLTAEPNPQGHAVRDMRPFGGRLYESVKLAPGDRLTNPESAEEPPILTGINRSGIEPTFAPLTPGVPRYGPGVFPSSLDFLHLSSDGEALWGAAGPVRESELQAGSNQAELTVTRDSAGTWSEVLGPGAESPGALANETVSSIAAEPGTEAAWLALRPRTGTEASATVARVSAAGAITDVQTLPSSQESAEGIGPKGQASTIFCSAAHDCWLSTTEGWLFHLAAGATPVQRELPRDDDPAFSKVIAYRPLDQGIPQVVPDEPPVDNSGLGELPSVDTGAYETAKREEGYIAAPLLTHVRTRLVHGLTLELSFHLAAKARIRLIAKRHGRTVASTPTLTLKAGNRHLLLRLNRRRWPTKLSLQTHALAKLPKISLRAPGNNSVSTSLYVLPRSLTQTGLLP